MLRHDVLSQVPSLARAHDFRFRHAQDDASREGELYAIAIVRAVGVRVFRDRDERFAGVLRCVVVVDDSRHILVDSENGENRHAQDRDGHGAMGRMLFVVRHDVPFLLCLMH